jgi:hypothetical protein
MVLYHYTFISALRNADPGNADPVGGESIYWSWSTGLRPGPDSAWTNGYFNLPAAVWFTTLPTPSGDFMKLWRGSQPHEFELRLTVELPPNTKRLVHWASYLREHRAEAITRSFTESMLITAETYYCYLGTVNQRHIRAMDHVRDLDATGASAPGISANYSLTRLMRSVRPHEIGR